MMAEADGNNLSRPVSAQEASNTQRPVSAQPQPQQVPQVQLILKPVNQGWEMGEDWEVFRPFASTMYDLRVMIEEEKGINRNRIMLRLKGKILQPARDKWTLRRLGLYDGYVIQVEPTMSGSWWWHPLPHYIDKFIHELEDFLDRQAEGGIYLSDMIPQIAIPPPIKQSLRVFLRMYPDHFHIYCDVRKNTFWVRRTQRLLEVPVFERYPHYLGKIKQFEMPDFDWDSYRDIDDKYNTEVFVSEEDLQLQQQQADEAAAAAAAAANAALSQEGETVGEADGANVADGAPSAAAAEGTAKTPEKSVASAAPSTPGSSSKSHKARSRSPSSSRKSPAAAATPDK
jgi:hypothetical protein